MFVPVTKGGRCARATKRKFHDLIGSGDGLARTIRLYAGDMEGDMTDKPADWSAPGPVQVAPGIHRIPLPMPGDGLHAVNVYAIADGSGLTMIDGGWALAVARSALEDA